MERLEHISRPEDPLQYYCQLIKIGQGASGGVFTAYTLSSSPQKSRVALKQINLEQQPKKDLIVNEIVVMKNARHKNIVNYMDSFLWKGDLWVSYYLCSRLISFLQTN